MKIEFTSLVLKIYVHIFNMKSKKPANDALQDRVWRRVRGKGDDWAFTPSDFADLGDPRSLGMVLTRLLRKDLIIRIRRGIYGIPQQHPLLGRIGPSASAITAAIVRRDALKLLPSGASAANELHLSTQVPAKTAYGIAGRSRVEATGGVSQVVFRRRSPKTMAMAGRASGWLCEALRNIGRANITAQRLSGLKSSLGSKQKRELLADLRYVPAWMRPFFQELARDE
jgi:hypothetical protein